MSKENKGLKGTIYVCLLCFLFLICTVKEIYAKTLKANWVKQQKSNWCWAASAENSVLFEKKITRHQKDAVKEIKGFFPNYYPNCMGGIKDIKEAAEYISKGTENYSYLNEKRPYTFLKKQVYCDNVTIVGYGYYQGKERNTGHYVSVIGYNDNGQKIIYFDSANGKTITYSYNKLTDGTLKTGKFSIKYDQTVYNLDR